MRLSIFCSLEDNWSIFRYTEELAAALPPSVETEKVLFPLRPGMMGKILDKHLLYLFRARKRQGDWNLDAQLVKLEEAGYVSVEKKLVLRKPQIPNASPIPADMHLPNTSKR